MKILHKKIWFQLWKFEVSLLQTHPLSLRRQVPGRSKEFDVLLAEHRFRTKLNDNSQSSSLSTPNSPNCQSPSGYEKIHFPSISSTKYVFYDHRFEQSSSFNSLAFDILKCIHVSLNYVLIFLTFNYFSFVTIGNFTLHPVNH